MEALGGACALGHHAQPQHGRHAHVLCALIELCDTERMRPHKHRVWAAQVLLVSHERLPQGAFIVVIVVQHVPYVALLRVLLF